MVFNFIHRDDHQESIMTSGGRRLINAALSGSFVRYS